MIKNFIRAFVITFSFSMLAYFIICAAIYDLSPH